MSRCLVTVLAATLACAAGLGASPVMAQSAAASMAQSQYEQALAACDPTQPRPAYNACVRAAGQVLDRSGTVSSGSTVNESSDGRATILQQPGTQAQVYAPPPPVVDDTTTSQDGRSTLMVPSNSTDRTTIP